MTRYDVFISYNWEIKPAVKKLYHLLTDTHNLKVWMDDFEMGQSRLTEELSSAISHSEVFLCCITKKYAESENCKDEIEYAKSLKKKFIVLMFERLGMEELGSVGFIIGPRVRFNCYKDPQMLDNWSSSEMFASILKGIKEDVVVSSVGNEKDTLHSNESLQEEKLLVSKNRKYFALVQKDANFVLYKSTTFNRDNPLWASNTWHVKCAKPCGLKLEENGNLVLKDKNGNKIWASASTKKGEPGDYKLILQNDGNLVIYDKLMSPTWATNTYNN